jgi:hypothetical protein
VDIAKYRKIAKIAVLNAVPRKKGSEQESNEKTERDVLTN